MAVLKSINPFDPSRIINYPQLSDMSLAIRLGRSQSTFAQYRNTSFEERASLMKRVAVLLRKRSKEFAETITKEMGKPVREAEAEVKKCAWVCEYYAENAVLFLEEKVVETEADESRVIFEPLGPVLAVMPWNFPFWQVFRFAAPSLMAGNAAILKHSSNVSGCALAIEEIFRKAGFPKNLFRTILLPSSQMDKVIKNEIIKAVTLTGSVPAGKAVAAIAGKIASPAGTCQP